MSLKLSPPLASSIAWADRIASAAGLRERGSASAVRIRVQLSGWWTLRVARAPTSWRPSLGPSGEASTRRPRPWSKTVIPTSGSRCTNPCTVDSWSADTPRFRVSPAAPNKHTWAAPDVATRAVRRPAEIDTDSSWSTGRPSCPSASAAHDGASRHTDEERHKKRRELERRGGYPRPVEVCAVGGWGLAGAPLGERGSVRPACRRASLGGPSGGIDRPMPTTERARCA